MRSFASCSEELSVEGVDGAVLAGTLALPVGSDVFPAVVGVHGSGGGTRQARGLQHLQSLLPPHGIAILTFDRRGEGGSTGAPRAAFEDLAGDVNAWVHRLRQHPGIDAARIGLWGVSQGGWIAPLAAAANPAIAFLIAVSPCGISPSAQMTYAAVTQLREAGYPESVIEKVTAIRRQIDECYRGRGDLDETRALVDGVRSEPWFASLNLPSPMSSGGQWRRIMDFDVRPALRRLNLPILLVFGQRDRWVPIDISAEIWRSSLRPDADLTIVAIVGTGHSPTLAFDPMDLNEAGPFAPEYEHVLVSWLRHRLAPGKA